MNQSFKSSDKKYDFSLPKSGQIILYIIILYLSFRFSGATRIGYMLFATIPFTFAYVITAFILKKFLPPKKKKASKKAPIFSEKTWQLINLITLAIIFITSFIEEIKNDFFSNLITYPLCFIIIYAIITGQAYVTDRPGSKSASQRGSNAWKEANGVEKVYINGNRYYRDHYGNYYSGDGSYVPVATPVDITQK